MKTRLTEGVFALTGFGQVAIPDRHERRAYCKAPGIVGATSKPIEAAVEHPEAGLDNLHPGAPLHAKTDFNIDSRDFPWELESQPGILVSTKKMFPPPLTPPSPIGRLPLD